GRVESLAGRACSRRSTRGFGVRSELRALQLDDQLLQAVVADAGAAFHAGAEHDVPHFLRGILHGGRQACLLALLRELCRHYRDGFWILLEDLGEHDAPGRADLAILTVEADLALRVAIHEAPLTADAQVDLTHRHGI